MTLIGDFLPSISNQSGKTAIDLAYRHSVILLSDAISMGLNTAGVNLGGFGRFLSDYAPVPLLGFVYETPSQIELLKYRYSEYPYLNKSLIVNSYVRENTRFTVRAYRLLTTSNPLPINISSNELYYLLLNEYCNRGGTFTLVTMWGVYNNCVLEEFVGIPPENNNGVGGTGFEFRFLRLHFNGDSIVKKIASGLQSLSRGVL